VNRPSLITAIVLSGIALGAFHYKLKSKPSERDLQDVAQGMSSCARSLRRTGFLPHQ
jgi:hypothetical protein